MSFESPNNVKNLSDLVTEESKSRIKSDFQNLTLDRLESFLKNLVCVGGGGASLIAFNAFDDSASPKREPEQIIKKILDLTIKKDLPNLQMIVGGYSQVLYGKIENLLKGNTPRQEERQENIRSDFEETLAAKIQEQREKESRLDNNPERKSENQETFLKFFEQLSPQEKKRLMRDLVDLM